MITEAISSNIEAALEKACEHLPAGHHHSARDHIASRLIEAAGSGRVSKSQLIQTAYAAVTEYLTQTGLARPGRSRIK